jgi:hypothetical protein
VLGFSLPTDMASTAEYSALSCFVEVLAQGDLNNP